VNDEAAIVSATSVMLAVFGFFYNSQRDTLAEARKLRLTESPDENERRARQAEHAGRVAAALALGAAVPAFLLLPELVARVGDAWGARLRDYETLPAVFVALACAWWVVVALMVLEARRHFRRRSTLRA